MITGFTTSVLSQCNDAIRRELNSSVVTNKVQLFRILRGMSLKRKQDDIEFSEVTHNKRPRTTVSFHTTCLICGRLGHRALECRKRILSKKNNLQQTKPETTKSIICYVCGQQGHIASSCPKRFEKIKDQTVTKEVNMCARTARGILEVEGSIIPFIFDSGSECSLVKESQSHMLGGEMLNETVRLVGIGRNSTESKFQIATTVQIQNIKIKITFHVLPDNCLRETIILGRDILDSGLSIEISRETLHFKDKITNYCSKSLIPFNIENIDTDLTGVEKNKLIEILNKHSNSFIKNLPRSRIKTGELTINLIDVNKTVNRRPYRLSPSELLVVDAKIKELLDSNIIRESSSPYASPILLVKKKDGSDRMCVDYRELNSNTVHDNYPLPLISDQIDKLSGAQYFSIIDMASGFHQLPVNEKSIKFTAFVTPNGQYEYLTMPFGLRNAPQVFQRAINSALRPLNDPKILVYMDDVLAASETIDEGLNRLNIMLSRLVDCGFSFNFNKCKFMKKRIEYLGFVISSGEIRPNTRKIEALTNVPSPTTATQVRQLIGLASYFRQFIPDFSRFIRPLYPLTKGTGKIEWTSEHDKIHKSIIQYLTNEPVLKIFDPSLPIEIHTDASSEGYGAVLIQKESNTPRVVAYFSQRTSDPESRYHSYELETLAVVRAVEHFRHYVYGRKFTVYTDCNSLKASHLKKDLTPRVHRWWAILQAFNFDIVYKEGKRMAHADFFSRNPSSDSAPFTTPRVVNFTEVDKNWLHVEQQRDPEISDIMSRLRSDELPDELSSTYDIRQGLLYRKIQRRKTTSWLPIVPRSLIWSLINHIHAEIKHLGYDKTLEKLYDLYWFPNMSKYVKKFTDSCVVCKSSKGSSGARQVQLHSIPKSTIPWHTVHVDISGKLSGKSERKEYCSVLIDSFTKFVLLNYAPSLNSSTAVSSLKKAINLFGTPKRVIADRGRSYDCSEFKEFCEKHNIDLHLIATGSPRANGQVERVMRTLKNILSIIESGSNDTWQDQISEIQLALNSTRCRVTGFSPLELMFGIKGSSLGITQVAVPSQESSRLNLQSCRSTASNNIQKLAQADSCRFNQGKATVKRFPLGEFVFVKCEERHQTKLDKKYKGPFKIIKVLDNDRYELKHVNGNNRIYKYAHENLRRVPEGQTGFLEIAENYSDDEEAILAEDSNNCLFKNQSQFAHVSANDNETQSVASDPNTFDPLTRSDNWSAETDTESRHSID